MIVIIPLGGTGKRFKENGYKVPKALIKVFGRPILYYLLDNLKNNKSIDFIYIPYNKEYESHRFEDVLKKDFPTLSFKFLKLNENTGGAAETLHIALRNLSCPDKPIISLDGDNFYTIDILTLWNLENKLITFEDIHREPIYSYIETKDNKVIKIAEKIKISNTACTGAYGFKSYVQLMKYTKRILDKNVKDKGEYYISTVIQEMIEDGVSFGYTTIDIASWHCLGTPIQVKFFCNNFPMKTYLQNSLQLKKLRICFDIDNTLVTFPKVKDDYSSVEPIKSNILFLQYLKELGHTIILYTARRMQTHVGNVGKALCDIGKITFDTLERFQVPFDEIYFGKPNADVYIDDLALNCYDNMEKALGFYMDTISPRDFNQINSQYIETYTKKSDDLSGEIYYYENVPKEIKDLFPILIACDSNKKWYTMEKIRGITITSMYLSEILTCTILKQIMDSIARIQSVPHFEDAPIYENYCKKLEKRFTTYDYSKFPNSQTIYNTLYEKLRVYEQEQRGRISCIHGDPVMSNIILSDTGKIKFIDMRGSLGHTVTIYGDWLYDWAKLYQSLVGYDKILQQKTISEDYEHGMRLYFETYFQELYTRADFENLKIITKSLLFTLIPLHDNEKCTLYYELIDAF